MHEPQNGRTHEPSLRELTAELDGLRLFLIEKVEGLRQIIDERHEQYKERATAGKEAISAALAAAEKATSAAIVASKETAADTKSAQADYNKSHNDLLKKQEAMIPRPEFDRATTEWRDKFEDHKKDEQKKMDEVKAEIAVLREYKSQNTGKEETQTKGHENIKWVVSLIVGLLLGVLSRFVGR